MAGISVLWTAPEINPVNSKARSIPVFNPINVYGRVFHFAWFGFFVAFWSWYAFPPLLTAVIAVDLDLTAPQIADSNIISLVATLLVRVISGPCCDKFGPRKTFAGLLLAGAVPTFCTGGIQSFGGLMAIRFFVGILGGTFVPCQVWTTGFFDKNTVGLANALTAGFGNAGGGVTYFIMPAVYKALVGDGLSSPTAWRVAFVVPGIVIVTVALALLLLCPDTPTGKWEDREKHVAENMKRHDMVGYVDVPGSITDKPSASGDESPSHASGDEKKEVLPPNPHFADNEAQLAPEAMIETAKGEVIRKPTLREIAAVGLSLQTLVTCACYFCSFGTELSVNSILGTYYTTNFPTLGLNAGNWAAMFGLLNAVFRPLGGLVADLAYRYSGSVWGKKILLHSYAIVTGAFLIAIGVLNPLSQSTMFGLIAGMAFFLEGGNGLNYALVPHVHPYANGVVSGFTGASGNLGGIVFAIIFRYVSATGNYGKTFWIIGIMTMGINLAVCWIPPIPRKQIGGR